MRDSEGFVRMRTLQCVVLFVFLLIGGRLAYIQLIDSRYNELAKANVLRHVVQYPPNCPRLAQILNSNVVHVIEDLVFADHTPDEGIGFGPYARVNRPAW